MICFSEDTLLERGFERHPDELETGSCEKNPFDWFPLGVGEYMGLKADSDELPGSEEFE